MEGNSSMNDFITLNKLGEGSFCQVYKVKRKQDGLEYAMKKVKLNTLSLKEKESALMEVRVLASINSPYIISYKDCFLESSTNTLCIIMELATGGDIMKKIQTCSRQRIPLLEKDIWKALGDMAKGLLILHDLNIFHRDLKGANVFIGSDGNYKLGDLNVSTVSKVGFAKTQTGTPYYCCPEIWQDKPYDAKCDIWSLGCIIYEMTMLVPPFRANDMRGLVQKVNRGVYDPIRNYSNDLTLIISSMIKVNPKQRPSSKELLSNPILLRRLTSDQNQPSMPSKMELMNTIKLPQNLIKLKDNLPKAKYNQERLNVSVERQLSLAEKLEQNIPIRQSQNHQIQRCNSASRQSNNNVQQAIKKPDPPKQQIPQPNVPRPQSYKPPVQPPSNPNRGGVPQPQKNVNLPRIPQSPRKAQQTPKFNQNQYINHEYKQAARDSSRNKDSRDQSREKRNQSIDKKDKSKDKYPVYQAPLKQQGRERSRSDYRQFY